MDNQERNEQVIKNYQKDEQMMIQIYVYWCFQNKVDPEMLYEKAYPGQQQNKALLEALEDVDPKEELEVIPTASVLHVLQLFGNDDLAFEVQQISERLKK
ncbi:hypothetical protein DX933_01080 [Ornithinibacillus gellani]|uniref:hypothetical protein n=1 Tax=Ornithinibacillus gellani TaxID=2293253 RepID=UPI000F4706C7|nr:hypothetical protein [Ornithinibacillus gellani]TQS76466.1 hypothetical protein DX933_01080 [Ornithinibacillus gellani]